MMLERRIHAFTLRMIENNMIDEADQEIYEYGYLLVCEEVIHLILSILLGIAFRSVGFVIAFLCVYIPLRSECGGWHADKFWKCTCVSGVILTVGMLGLRFCYAYLFTWNLWAVFLIGCICILIFAPEDTPAKPLSEQELRVCRTKMQCFVGIDACVMALLTTGEYRRWMFAVAYAVVMQAIMLLIGRVRNDD